MGAGSGKSKGLSGGTWGKAGDEEIKKVSESPILVALDCLFEKL